MPIVGSVSGQRGRGSLAGLVVIEMAAIGPVPHCGLVLSELGADVVRLDRLEPSGLGIEVAGQFDALARGKRSLALDLKSPNGAQAALELVGRADALIEGFRPGVMERLGLGPDRCLAANPRLVYGRISGWGETGPLAGEAGHDLNFLGLTGALAAMGEPGQPPPVPLNLVADFGGGAMQLAVGVLAALLEARTTGQGQVVATSILEGAHALMPFLHGLRAAGAWEDRRGANVLDGGAPFYRCYEASDGRYVAVAAIERKFYRALLKGLELLGQVNPAVQMDRTAWPALAGLFASVFRTRPRDDWARRFQGTDACVTPVLTFNEALDHEQISGCVASTANADLRVPRAVPRFSAHRQSMPSAFSSAGNDS